MLKTSTFAIVGLLAGVLSMTGCAGGGTSAGASAPTATVTVTETVTPDTAAESTEAADSSTAELKPSDFKIKLKIREKACFGSAGCNVVFQIDPRYVGAQDLSSGSYDVTYKVLGGEDGPKINTFTIDDGQASYDEEESLSTSSESATLRAKVTDVSTRDW
ncbi:MAG TPA: hypothetical protein VF049_18560 [Nocardioidaceae bacterium]